MRMARIKPKAIQRGATFGVVATSSPVFDISHQRRSVKRVTDAGYHLKFAEHSDERWGAMSGTGRDRADDLHAAFTDPDVDAVLALRGGYGGAEMLPHLDHRLIAANPKPFIGMSDVTILHTAIGQKAGLVTFWGPNLTAGLGKASAYTWERFERALTGADPLGMVDPDPDDAYVETIVGGVAEGELVGGTTTLLCATLGTPDEIDTAGKILLLEDVAEEPYRIDGMLVHLAQAGKLQEAAGVVLSAHTDCRPKTFPAGQLGLGNVFDRIFQPLGIPAMHGLPLGHGAHLATVPFGVDARLDADAGTLEITGRATA